MYPHRFWSGFAVVTLLLLFGMPVSHACVIEPMTAQQALDSADVVIVGTVVRKEPAHRWVSRAWSRHAPLWLGGNPIDADRAVAYVHVDDALKGGTVGAQIPVQALSDATQSTCSWE